MINREDLESLSIDQLHDQAISFAKANADLDWLWQLLRSIPGADGQIGDLEDSGMDAAATVTAINGYLRADPNRADGQRDRYIDYILEQQ